ncbi:hypothetical protein BIW11_12249 [Tropilaelaps mercedesae]|uniref:Uncharacterized protein n=1 Tax=Tropilaelaps mercedesae TaxID=418985 RepID=A0A1V9X786_9ACAR|nr:hypothetical protein BIW11_12249 [Tropilaelaps mercedesae]
MHCYRDCSSSEYSS